MLSNCHFQRGKYTFSSFLMFHACWKFVFCFLTGFHSIVKTQSVTRSPFCCKFGWRRYRFVSFDVSHHSDSHAFYFHCQWRTIWKTIFIQWMEMPAENELASTFVSNSSNSFVLWNWNGLYILFSNHHWTKLEWFHIFHRLILSFFEIYRIILTILFLGVLGAILLALLMIQLDLAQVHWCWRCIPYGCYLIDLYLDFIDWQRDRFIVIIWIELFGFWCFNIDTWYLRNRSAIYKCVYRSWWRSHSA